jgi:hypothetical protein
MIVVSRMMMLLLGTKKRRRPRKANGCNSIVLVARTKQTTKVDRASRGKDLRETWGSFSTSELSDFQTSELAKVKTAQRHRRIAIPKPISMYLWFDCSFLSP